MSAAEQARRSAAACQRALALPEMASARKAMLFVTMPDEIDTRPLVEACLAEGKSVYAPRSLVKPRRMVPCRLRNLGLVRPGAFGILEPPGDEVCAPDALDVVFVPALGFDRRGNRLGKGAGYYDRFMASPGFRAARVGIGFACQLVEAVPVEPHDLPVQIIVTPEETIRTGR